MHAITTESSMFCNQSKFSFSLISKFQSKKSILLNNVSVNRTILLIIWGRPMFSIRHLNAEMMIKIL